MWFAPALGSRRLSPLWSRVLVALTFVYALIIIAECFGGKLNVFDESLYCYGALLVSRGQRVHLDFHSMYPPFNYQPAAWMFSLLGETVQAARLVHIVLYVALLAGLASLFRREGVSKPRLTILILASLTLTATLPSLPSFMGVCLALLAMVAYLRSLAEASKTLQRTMRILATAMAALTLFTRVNFGSYVLALIVIDGCIAVVHAHREPRGQVAARSIELGEVIVSACFSIASLATIFRRQLPAFIDQVLIAPSLGLWTYSKPAFGADGAGITGLLLLTFVPSWLALRASPTRARRLWFAIALAMLALGAYSGVLNPHGFTLLGFLAIVAPIANQFTRAALKRSEFAALLGCALFLHYYVSLPDFAHQFPATAPLAFLLPPLVTPREANWPTRLHQRAGIALVTLLAAPVALRTAGLSNDALTGFHLMATKWPKEGDAARISESWPYLGPPLSAVFPDENESIVVRFLRPRTGEFEPVYVGLMDHSRPFINNMRLYFALGRLPGTRHHMLGSGVSNTPEAESAMIQDLIERGVRWVVLSKGYAPYRGFPEQNPPGARLLDDYLSAHYSFVAAVGPFEIRRRP
jgi:hypothetical protein